ncbi:MAG: 2-phospho-L-lactate guanylyltransferase [Pseudomonadota bacterium]
MTCEVWALIPVKNTEGAKQRLSPVLSPDDRQGLFLAMLGDVLTALAGARRLDGTLVLTRDPTAAGMATAVGAEVASETSNDGHSAAVQRGAEHLRARGRDAMLALPADIPLLQSAEVDALIESLKPGPALSIAPSLDEFGSNGVLVSPPDLFEFAFGDDSFRPHLARARAAGADPAVLELPGFQLDVDRPDDLRRFASQKSDTRAYRYLLDRNLLGKLCV